MRGSTDDELSNSYVVDFVVYTNTPDALTLTTIADGAYPIVGCFENSDNWNFTDYALVTGVLKSSPYLTLEGIDSNGECTSTEIVSIIDFAITQIF